MNEGRLARHPYVFIAILSKKDHNPTMPQPQFVTSNVSSHFVLTRLFSLTGVLPLAYFFLHFLYLSVQIFGGTQNYDQAIWRWQSSPFAFFSEVFLIYLPLAFHTLYGLALLFEGRSNVHAHPHFANWRYLAQRFTALVALFFLVYHLYVTRWLPYELQAQVSTNWMIDVLSQQWVVALYIVGIISVSFHLFNGLWNFLINWGITVSRHSQKISLILNMALCFLVSLIGVLSVLKFYALSFEE